MKKKLWRVFILVFILLLNIVVFCYLSYINRVLNIEKIDLQIYNAEEKNYIVQITKQKDFFDFFQDDISCIAFLGDEKITAPLHDNQCLLTLPVNKNYQVILQSSDKESSSYNLLDYLNNILDFEFTYPKIYLIVGEETEIEFSDVLINPAEIDYQFTSSDSSIVRIENKIIKGISPGTAFVTSPLVEDKMEVVVTDLITFPTYQKQYKQHLPCNYYTKEQADLLDEILAYRINKVGYQTRAAAIETARFLTLSFPYRIPYFYENGRVHESGVNYADGEGRYYKQGLFGGVL